MAISCNINICTYIYVNIYEYQGDFISFIFLKWDPSTRFFQKKSQAQNQNCSSTKTIATTKAVQCKASRNGKDSLAQLENGPKPCNTIVIGMKFLDNRGIHHLKFELSPKKSNVGNRIRNKGQKWTKQVSTGVTHTYAVMDSFIPIEIWQTTSESSSWLCSKSKRLSSTIIHKGNHAVTKRLVGPDRLNPQWQRTRSRLHRVVANSEQVQMLLATQASSRV